MPTSAAEMTDELLCHRCGYDVRAQPADGVCPECAEPVAESRRLAAVPRRPRWRDSDPRWRRRMLAGVWLLVFLPLMDLLTELDWTSSIPVPSLLDLPEPRRLDRALISSFHIYSTVLFCMGVVLLFAKERGRRASKLDWTRRWGVLCSYLVLIIFVSNVLLVAGLVMIGISAMFLSLPPPFQPAGTDALVEIGAAIVWYGPHPEEGAAVVATAAALLVVLLACVPLFEALRSCGPRWLALIVVLPLGAFSLLHGYEAGEQFLKQTQMIYYSGRLYFEPRLVVEATVGDMRSVWGSVIPTPRNAVAVELVKWGIVLAIAVWLSVAQIASWRRRAE